MKAISRVAVLVAGSITILAAVSVPLRGEPITLSTAEDIHEDGVHGQIGTHSILRRHRNEGPPLELVDGNKPWSKVPLTKRPDAQVADNKTPMKHHLGKILVSVKSEKKFKKKGKKLGNEKKQGKYMSGQKRKRKKAEESDGKKAVTGKKKRGNNDGRTRNNETMRFGNQKNGKRRKRRTRADGKKGKRSKKRSENQKPLDSENLADDGSSFHRNGGFRNVHDDKRGRYAGHPNANYRNGNWRSEFSEGPGSFEDEGGDSFDPDYTFSEEIGPSFEHIDDFIWEDDTEHDVYNGGDWFARLHRRRRRGGHYGRGRHNTGIEDDMEDDGDRRHDRHVGLRLRRRRKDHGRRGMHHKSCELDDETEPDGYGRRGRHAGCLHRGTHDWSDKKHNDFEEDNDKGYDGYRRRDSYVGRRGWRYGREAREKQNMDIGDDTKRDGYRRRRRQVGLRMRRRQNGYDNLDGRSRHENRNSHEEGDKPDHSQWRGRRGGAEHSNEHEEHSWSDHEGHSDSE